MARLSKQQSREHQKACELLTQDALTDADKDFIFDHWQESASHLNGLAGAFFTPRPIADLMSIEISGIRKDEKTRVIDLCGGIGALSYPLTYKFCDEFDLTIVELNPDYLEVGKKLLPKARWILADVLNLPSDLGHFDFAIANPPFGVIKSNGTAPRYSGAQFEYKVLDVASNIADFGVFILPQTSCSFKLSGQQCFSYDDKNEKYQKFVEQTGIEIDPNCGLDTEECGAQWHGVKVTVEIACIDFIEARNRRQQHTSTTTQTTLSAPLLEETVAIPVAALAEPKAVEVEELTVAVATMDLPDESEIDLGEMPRTPEPIGTPVQQDLFSFL